MHSAPRIICTACNRSKPGRNGPPHRRPGFPPWAAGCPAMAPLPRFIEIDGRRYLWRDLVALRRAQAKPAELQPALFTLREDHRSAGERTAAERYREPNLFTALERRR